VPRRSKPLIQTSAYQPELAQSRVGANKLGHSVFLCGVAEHQRVRRRLIRPPREMPPVRHAPGMDAAYRAWVSGRGALRAAQRTNRWCRGAQRVLSNVLPGMATFDQGFGPAASLIVARGVDHAIALANNNQLRIAALFGRRHLPKTWLAALRPATRGAETATYQ